MAPQIKICGITSPEAASHASHLGADYVGVIFHPKSPRHVPLDRIENIFRRVHTGRRVLVSVNPTALDLANWSQLSVDYFQIHFDLDTPVGDIADWVFVCGPKRIWLAPRIPPDQERFPRVLLESAETFLVDTYSAEGHGGTGRTGDWQRFMDWSTLYSHKRWILAGGLNPGNLAEALRLTHAAVVDVNSGVESAPGIKDPDKVAAAIAAVRGYAEPA